jgi:hypothetical protein
LSQHSPHEKLPQTDPDLDIVVDEPRSKRVRRRLAVSLLAQGQGQVAGWTLNLSTRGLVVSAARTFPQGTELKVVVQLPDQERATVRGEVIWERGGDGSLGEMGVRFLEESPSYLAFFRRFHPEVLKKG